MVSVSRLWHHCINAVGCGCFLKVYQWYIRLLLWWDLCQFLLWNSTHKVVGVLYFAGAGCDLCHSICLQKNQCLYILLASSCVCRRSKIFFTTQKIIFDCELYRGSPENLIHQAGSKPQKFNPVASEFQLL